MLWSVDVSIQIVKQSQAILNFLAIECYITNEHIDIMWASAQVSVNQLSNGNLIPRLTFCDFGAFALLSF